MGIGGRLTEVHPAVAPAMLWVLLIAEQLAVQPPGMPVAVIGACVIAAGLMARRRHPLFSVLAVAGTLAAEAPLGVSTQDTSVPIIPVFWVVFLTFAALHGRRRGIAVVALIVAIVAGMLLEGGRLDVANLQHSFLFTLALAVPPAIAGLYSDSRHRYTLALEAEARAREALREAETEKALIEERLGIARELHDVIAHGVGVMGIQAGAVRLRLQPGQDELARVLGSIEETGRSAIAELARVLGILRAEATDMAPQPTLADLPALVSEARTSGQNVAFTLEGRGGLVPAGIAVSTYRIVQELLTNARKHAPESSVEVKVEINDSAVHIAARNAFHTRDASSGGTVGGYGLAGIRERVEAYGGGLELSQGGGLFTVDASLPVGQVQRAG